jgi:hypothetical protein
MTQSLNESNLSFLFACQRFPLPVPHHAFKEIGRPQVILVTVGRGFGGRLDNHYDLHFGFGEVGWHIQM